MYFNVMGQVDRCKRLMENLPEVMEIVDSRGKLAGVETEVGILTGEEAGNVTENVVNVDMEVLNQGNTESRGATGS